MAGYIKVHFEMGTRYIINALLNDFIGVLEKALREDKGIDIANCKLGPGPANELARYYTKLDIIDSVDSERNSLLQGNIKAKKDLANLEPYTKVDFSRINNISSTAAFLGNLKDGDKICPDNVNTEKSLAALCFCIMVKPEVDFDISDYLPRIYYYIVNEWKMLAKPHNKYIRLMRPDYQVYECINGIIETEDKGKLTENNFVQSLDVLPYEFGTKVLVEYDENGETCGEWAAVTNKLLNTLGMVKIKEHSILTKLDYN